MRTNGSQPRILLTNVKQLELLLTRQVDIDLFVNARLEYLVFDEAHTFTGINGAETACLIRRLRNFCGRNSDQTTCMATSATIVDQKDPDAARKFASRFFGVPADAVVTINEEYQRAEWKKDRYLPRYQPQIPTYFWPRHWRPSTSRIPNRSFKQHIRNSPVILCRRATGGRHCSKTCAETSWLLRSVFSLLRPRELYFAVG